jgi:peroxiredoxin
MLLKIGDKAPEFTLKDSDGNDVSLSDYAGKPLVILFFPLAFTGVCTKELCIVRDNMIQYNSLGVDVIAISVDSFFTLAQFKQQQALNFKLLSDFNKTTAKAYGALYDEFFGMVGVAKRSAFIVDKNMTLSYCEILEKASDLPNFEAIRSTLTKL